MKTTFLLLPILLISLSTYSLCSSADASPDAVRDIDGDILRTGAEYYILPGLRGMGGAVTLASTTNESCPLSVVQAQLEDDNGNLPLSFTPVNPKKGVIRESSDLNIEFQGATICIQSLLWKLVNYEGEYIVTLGGIKGNPGIETLSNWFKIEKYMNNYKFVFCPTVCDTCKPVCGDIGIAVRDGFRRLVLSDEPFMVKFLKA